MSDQVFISYSRQDSEFVLKLANDLETRGAKAWIDRGDIRAGSRWRLAISDAVKDCAAFVLVISPDSVASDYVAHELSMAEAHDKPIFPLIYRKATLPQIMAGQLEGFQRLDFRRGGYDQNLADLVAGLIAQGVPPGDAPEATRDRLAERRRQRMGQRVPTKWRAVFSKIPGWALAWGIGWAIYWLVLPIVLLVAAGIFGGDSGGDLEGSPLGNLMVLPMGGFLGGIVGGLVAGFVTMLVLRRHASTIAWKHMSASIRIWGLVGPIGTTAAGGLAVLFFNPESVQTPEVDCSALGFAECFGGILVAAFAGAIVVVMLLVLLVLLYVFIALFLIGAVAGGLVVRHIRRLEPGILGRQAVWVVAGWGAGSLSAALASVVAIAFMAGE